MQTAILATYWILIALIAAAPVFFARHASRFWPGFWRAHLFGAFLVIFFAWWAHAALTVELWWMGADNAQRNHDAAMAALGPEERDRAFFLNARRNGVGWPIYALFGLAINVAFTSAAYSAIWYASRRKAT